MTDNSFDYAKSLLNQWASCFQTVTTTFFAVDDGGGYVIRFARVNLEPVAREIESRLYRTASIAAGIVTRKFTNEELSRYVGWLNCDSIEISEEGLHLTHTPPTDTRSRFFPIRIPGFNDAQQRMPGVIFTGPQSALGNADILDLELMSSETPFNGIVDLLSFLGIPTNYQYGGDKQVELVLSLPAMVGAQSTIKNQRLYLFVLASQSISKDSVRIGAKLVTNDKPTTHLSISSDEIAWKEEGNILIGSVEKDVADANYVQLFLSYNSEWLHTYWVSDPSKLPNSRLAVYDLFDESHKQLDKLLHNPGTDARNFEVGTALLLELLGFNVSHFGATKLSDGPDLVAETPNRRLAVIECTTKISDLNEKIGKLLQRCMRIKDASKNMASSYVDILPVLFTNLPSGEVQHFQKAASEQGTLLSAMGTIEELEGRLQLPVDPERIFDDAKEELLRLQQNLQPELQ